MKKFMLGCALIGVFCTTPALANNQTKVSIVKQMVYSGDLIYDNQVITDNLFDLTHKMEKMEEYVQEHYQEIGCESPIRMYLGHNYGEDTYIQNVRVNVVNDNLVRATFQKGHYADKMSEAVLLEFVMQGNKVNDVRVGYSSNPNKPPTTTESSLQAELRRNIKTHCGFKTR